MTPAAAYARCMLGIASCAAAFAMLPWLAGEIGLGALTGFAFHLAPALVPVAVGCSLFELWWMRDRRKWASLVVVAVKMQSPGNHS